VGNRTITLLPSLSVSAITLLAGCRPGIRILTALGGMRMAGGLIGRDSELSRLCRPVDPPPVASEVRVLPGEPGMGKTALLTAVTEAARPAGPRVLPVTGREPERDPALAGLHQLVRPVLARVPALPGRQAQALLGA
jgi:hypothetical protein